MMFTGNPFVFVLCAALFVTVIATITHDEHDAYRKIVNQVLAEHEPKLNESQMLKLAHASLMPGINHDTNFVQALENIDAEFKKHKKFEPKWLTHFLNEQVLEKANAHIDTLSGEEKEQAKNLYATLDEEHKSKVNKIHHEHGVDVTLD